MKKSLKKRIEQIEAELKARAEPAGYWRRLANTITNAELQAIIDNLRKELEASDPEELDRIDEEDRLNNGQYRPDLHGVDDEDTARSIIGSDPELLERCKARVAAYNGCDLLRPQTIGGRINPITRGKGDLIRITMLRTAKTAAPYEWESLVNELTDAEREALEGELIDFSQYRDLMPYFGCITMSGFFETDPIPNGDMIRILFDGRPDLLERCKARLAARVTP
jgi:hypothetical protein